MEYSKKIEHGSVVTMKGNKLILASCRTKRPTGVFMVKSEIRGFELDGTLFAFNIPCGVRTYGEAQVKVGNKQAM